MICPQTLHIKIEVQSEYTLMHVLISTIQWCVSINIAVQNYGIDDLIVYSIQPSKSCRFHRNRLRQRNSHRPRIVYSCMWAMCMCTVLKLTVGHFPVNLSLCQAIIKLGWHNILPTSHLIVSIAARFAYCASVQYFMWTANVHNFEITNWCVCFNTASAWTMHDHRTWNQRSFVSWFAGVKFLQPWLNLGTQTSLDLWRWFDMLPAIS